MTGDVGCLLSGLEPLKLVESIECPEGKRCWLPLHNNDDKMAEIHGSRKTEIELIIVALR